ncbi:MAG: hypothetical protein QXM75_03460 [Candidatus Diapherotrites archaeon]
MGAREKLRPKKSKEKKEGKIHSKIKKLQEKLKWIDPFTYTDMLLEKIGQKDNKLVAWPLEVLVAFVTAWLIYFLLGLALNTKSPAVVVMSGSMIPTFYRGDIMVLQGVSYESLVVPEVILNENIAGRKLSDYAVTYCSVNSIADLVECRVLLQNPKVKITNVQTKKVCFKSIAKCVDINKEGDIVVYYSDTLHEPIIHRAVVKIRAKDGNFVLTKGDNNATNFFLDQDAGIASSAVPVERLDGKAIFMIPYLGYVKLFLMDDLPCILASYIRYGDYKICTGYWSAGRLGIG